MFSLVANKSFFKMILGTYERKIVSVNEGIPVWLFVCCVWEESQSKATHDFQRGTHVMASL